MNREAAALGTPVFTTFDGRMGGVDEALIAAGRLRVLDDPAGAGAAQARAGRSACLRRRDPTAPGRGCPRGRRGRRIGLRPPGPRRRAPARWHRQRTPSSPSSSAAAIAWLTRPLDAERLAFRIGAIDLPNERSLHDRADAPARRPGDLRRGPRRRLDLASVGRRDAGDPVGAAAIAAVGVVDDVARLRPLPKLLGQTVAVIVPWSRRRPVERLHAPLPRRTSNCGWVAYPLDGDRHRRGDQRDQPHRRRRRPRRRRLRDLGRRPGGDRPLARPQRRRRARRAHGGRRRSASCATASRPPATFMGDTGSNLLGYLLGRRRGAGRAEDERGDRPLPAADRPHRADPRHRLRRRQAAQIRPPDLPGRPLALPPPDGQHRLLPAAHARLSLRLDARDARPRAGPALRPLQRRPRQLRRPLDRGDGGLRRCVALAASVYLVYGAGDPQAAPGARGRSSRPAPGEDREAAADVDRAAVDRARRRAIAATTATATGSDKPHELGSRKRIEVGPFGYSRLSARSAPSRGGFYVSSQVRRPNGPGRRARGFRAWRTAAARLRRRGRRLARAARHPGRWPAAVPPPTWPPATASGRWGSSPRRRSAASG